MPDGEDHPIRTSLCVLHSRTGLLDWISRGVLIALWQGWFRTTGWNATPSFFPNKDILLMVQQNKIGCHCLERIIWWIRAWGMETRAIMRKWWPDLVVSELHQTLFCLRRQFSWLWRTWREEKNMLNVHLKPRGWLIWHLPSTSLHYHFNRQ